MCGQVLEKRKDKPKDEVSGSLCVELTYECLRREAEVRAYELMKEAEEEERINFLKVVYPCVNSQSVVLSYE